MAQNEEVFICTRQSEGSDGDIVRLHFVDSSGLKYGQELPVMWWMYSEKAEWY